jgi:hypothetical protein
VFVPAPEGFSVMGAPAIEESKPAEERVLNAEAFVPPPPTVIV